MTRRRERLRAAIGAIVAEIDQNALGTAHDLKALIAEYYADMPADPGDGVITQHRLAHLARSARHLALGNHEPRERKPMPPCCLVCDEPVPVHPAGRRPKWCETHRPYRRQR